MSISQGRLKEIQNAPTVVGGFRAALAAFVDDQTITADTAGILNHALDAHPDLEVALLANLKAKTQT